MQEPKLLSQESNIHGVDTGDVATRLIEARHETSLNRVGSVPLACTIGMVVVAALATTLVDGERTTPNSARRKQANRSSRAHTKKWRSIGWYSPN